MNPSVARIVASIAILAGCSDSTGPPRLHSLRINFARAGSLPVGDTLRATVTGYDQLGVPYSTGEVTWSSHDPLIASITEEGLVLGRSLGSTPIVAQTGGLSTSLSLMVAGTLHRDAMTANETWTAAASPHVVEGLIPVGGPGGVVLTIDAGVTVRFRVNSGLDIGLGGDGILRADGTGGTITFRPDIDSWPLTAWRGLTFWGPGQSELRNVAVQGCGDTYDRMSPCLMLRDPVAVPAPTLLLDQVTILETTTTAILLEGRSRFAAGSTGLSVQYARGVVAYIPAASAGTFPLGGVISQNETNEIRLTEEPFVFRHLIDVTTTWGAPGDAVWHLYHPVVIEGPSAPTLTIAAGASFILDNSVSFIVGQDAPGGLRVGATGGGWVLMTGEGNDTWGGLHFFANTLPSAVTKTTLQRCGSGNGGCVTMSTGTGQGAPAPVLDSVTIRSPDGLGVAALPYGRFGAGSRMVRITGSIGFPMMLWSGAAATIPSGSFTGNAADGILMVAETVTDSVTWPNPGVPYLLQDLPIEGTKNPVLTLAPGVVLKFAQYAQLRVGVLAPGGLRAIGSAGAPVTLTSQSQASPGFWRGVLIGSLADPGTMLDHAVVDDAGAFQPGTPQAAVQIAQDYGEIVQHTTVRRSGDCGIARLTGVPWTTDFTAATLNNSFQDNGGPDQCGP